MVQKALPHGKVGTISAKRLADGRWRARARVGYLDGGELTSFQVSRIAPTKKAATALIPQAAKDALEAREATTRDPETPETMAQLLRAWRDSLQAANVHDRTRQDYGYTVAALLGEDRLAKHTKANRKRSKEPAAKAFAKIATMAPKDVTEQHIRVLLLAVASEVGPGAAERVRAVLRNVFREAKKYKIATENPAMGLEYLPSDSDDYRVKPKRDDGLQHDRAPTDEEVRELLLALAGDRIAGRPDGTRSRSKKGERFGNPQDISDLTYLLFSTGVRLGEALALRWADLNLSEESVQHRIERVTSGRKHEWATITIPPAHVSVNGTITRIVGKGVVRSVTKSAAGCRVIPLSGSVLTLLKARAEALGVPYLARPDRPVFGALTDPARYREPGAVSKSLAHIYDSHGVEWHRSHGARKYVTTKLHRLGYDDNRIMRYMGWSNPNTLLGYLDRRQSLPEDMGTALDLASTGAPPALLKAV